MVVFGENCDLFIAISVLTGIKRLVGDPTETPTQAKWGTRLGWGIPDAEAGLDLKASISQCVENLRSN